MQKNKLSEIAEFEAYKKNVFTCDKNIKNHQKLSWCFRSKKSLPTKVIWGDSHAEHLFPGIAEKDQEVNWLVIGQTGCPPLLGVEVFRKGNIDQCVKRNQFALDTILNLPSVDTVVLASLAPFYITNSGYAAGQTGENSPSHWNVRALRNESDELSKEDIFYAGMDLAITRLEAAGKDVILYQDVPEVPFVPAECLQRPLSPKPDKCKRPLSKEVIFKRQEVYRALFAKLKQAHPQIKIFDSTYYLCDEKSCYVRANKKFLYRDGHHLSMEGSRFLARPFLYWLNNERI
ncbi:MAG: hypothetical protein HQ491_06140 [Bacteroidetes bacterium]|nr:hypothetical protein [Bacteroidota bacterium]